MRVEPCSLEGGRFAGDYGLLLSESHKHYAVGASLAKPVDNAGKVGPLFPSVVCILNASTLLGGREHG